MRHHSRALTYLWILLVATPLVASTTRIWVLNLGSDTIDVIDPATNKIVQTIQGVLEPHGVAFSPDGKLAYVAGESEKTDTALYEIDTNTGEILRKAPLSVKRGNVPAITKDGKRLLVCGGAPRDERGLVMNTGGALDIVDTATLKVTKSFPFQGHDCYTTPDGKYWIAGAGKYLTVIDIETEQPVWKLYYEENIAPVAIDINRDGSTRRLFVTPMMNLVREFAVVDFAAQKEVTRIRLPLKPNGFRLAPPLTRRNPIPVHGMEISPDRKTLAVASRDANGVFFYSLPDLKVIGFVPAPTMKRAEYPNNGSDPGWVTFTPDSKTLYLANAADSSVSVIDVKSMKEVTRVPVGKQPDHVWTLVRP